MNNKPNKKNWFDVKIFIASLGFLSTVWLWNSFSKDLVKTTQAQFPPTNEPDSTIQAAKPIIPTTQPTPFTRILMGGAPPQVYQADNSAPEPITQTHSSR
jgi:hypothetical protein